MRTRVLSTSVPNGDLAYLSSEDVKERVMLTSSVSTSEGWCSRYSRSRSVYMEAQGALRWESVQLLAEALSRNLARLRAETVNSHSHIMTVRIPIPFALPGITNAVVTPPLTVPLYASSCVFRPSRARR